MAADRSPLASALIFNIDTAAPVDAPPVLFHVIRVPCSCGRSLQDNAFTFFPGSVFVHGTCESCGPQTAIFAPHMKDAQERLPTAIARTMARLTTEMAKQYGEDPQTVIAEFLSYLTPASVQEVA